MADLPSPDPMQAKLLLALFGALVGWAIKALWDEYQVRRRWRRLAPLVLRQLKAVARQGAEAFDDARLPRMAAKLATAHGYAVEIVAAGVRVDDWLEGLERLSDLLDAVHAAESTHDLRKGEAMGEVRSSSLQLREWVGKMRG